MWFAEKPCQPGAEHPVESFLGDKARAEKNNDIRANASKTAENFFAVHERHGEVEHNQIEVVLDACGKDPDIQSRIERSRPRSQPRRECAWPEPSDHRLVVDHEKRPFFCNRRRCGFLCPAKAASSGWNKTFLLGTASVLDKLRCHLSRAINAGPKHVKILLRSVIAIPDVLDGRARPGNDFQQIVQLARGVSGRLGRGATL